MSGSFDLTLGLTWRAARKPNQHARRGAPPAPVGGRGGDGEQVTFMGEAVTLDGEPVIFTEE